MFLHPFIDIFAKRKRDTSLGFKPLKGPQSSVLTTRPSRHSEGIVLKLSLLLSGSFQKQASLSFCLKEQESSYRAAGSCLLILAFCLLLNSSLQSRGTKVMCLFMESGYSIFTSYLGCGSHPNCSQLNKSTTKFTTKQVQLLSLTSKHTYSTFISRQEQ